MWVAVLDDVMEDAKLLIQYLNRFQSENDVSIQIDTFYASFDFLEEYESKYDVVFLDIEMPGSNGIDVAREIRAKDEAVGIIFITDMAQYAICGYEVNAIDFMIKPVGYFNFSEKMKKAIRFSEKRNKCNLLLNSEEGIQRISTYDIFYIEKDRDNLLFHTEQGNFKERGTIKDIKQKLEGLPFAECMSGCLVNLNYVRRVGKDTISLEKSELPLSRRMKKQFSQDYINYVGGGF